MLGSWLGILEVAGGGGGEGGGGGGSDAWVGCLEEEDEVGFLWILEDFGFMLKMEDEVV